MSMKSVKMSAFQLFSEKGLKGLRRYQMNQNKSIPLTLPKFSHPKPEYNTLINNIKNNAYEESLHALVSSDYKHSFG